MITIIAHFLFLAIVGGQTSTENEREPQNDLI